MDIVNVNDRHAELIIGDTGDTVQHGQTIEVPDDLGERLLQSPEWAKPTTKVAKKAKKLAPAEEVEPSPAEDAAPDSKEHA